MQYDYIIVGQGLSGSLLAHFLSKFDRKVLVFDDLEQSPASSVAAGIFNPFTGRKLVKTWMADVLFPYLQDYYRTLEGELGVTILHNLPMYRPFLNVDEQNEWGTRLYDERYSPYIESIVSPQDALSQVTNPLGGLMLKRSGYVDISTLVASIREWLLGRAAFIHHQFDPSKLEVHGDKVCYQEHQARYIIFCEGPWVGSNRFFDWLPMRPVKGEILEIELEETLDVIINRGVFVLPYDGKNCKVGATFDNRNIDWQTTESGKQYLKRGLEKLLQMPYKIKNQMAGVRPASLDRRPLIGLHPEYEPLAVFNGLGTKGVSLAPYLIEQFCEFLERGKPMDPEVTISRYFSLYYNKI